jgi:hypothetical protein
MSDRDRNWRREREAQHRKRKEKQSPRVSHRPKQDDDHDRRWDRFDLPHEEHDLDD